MNGKMVVTNLRINEHDWNQIRAVAAEMGLSANKYVERLIKESTIQRELGLPKQIKAIKKKEKNFLLELHKLAKKVEHKPMGASEEDKIIYGL